MVALNSIDETDYAILVTLKEAGEPLWKNKIYEKIKESHETLPMPDSVSVQTVGRHVDELRDKRFIDSHIIKPDDTPRDLIIAFSLTEQGETAIKQKRESLLKQALCSEVFGIDVSPDMNKEALIQLAAEHLGLDEDTCETLRAKFNKKELLTALNLVYAEQEAQSVFDDSELWKLSTVNEDITEFRDTLLRETGSP